MLGTFLEGWAFESLPPKGWWLLRVFRERCLAGRQQRLWLLWAEEQRLWGLR